MTSSGRERETIFVKRNNALRRRISKDLLFVPLFSALFSSFRSVFLNDSITYERNCKKFKINLKCLKIPQKVSFLQVCKRSEPNLKIYLNFRAKNQHLNNIQFDYFWSFIMTKKSWNFVYIQATQCRTSFNLTIFLTENSKSYENSCETFIAIF